MMTDKRLAEIADAIHKNLWACPVAIPNVEDLCDELINEVAELHAITDVQAEELTELREIYLS